MYLRECSYNIKLFFEKVSSFDFSVALVYIETFLQLNILLWEEVIYLV